MAIRTLYIKMTKIMENDRFPVWTASIGNRNHLVDMPLVLFFVLLPISLKLNSSSFLVIIVMFLRCWKIVFTHGLLLMLLLLMNSLSPVALIFLFLLLCSQNILLMSINLLSFILLQDQIIMSLSVDSLSFLQL